MTNNDALEATTARLIASTSNALAASRYAAETNAMTFAPAKAPDRSRNFARTTPRSKHSRKTIR